MNQEQLIAVVTGANRGLGWETCRQLAQKGIKVILTARDHAKGQKAAAQLQQQGLDVIFHVLDVTSVESVNALQGMLRSEYGRLDILVNNAGIFPDYPDQSSIFDSNLEILRQAMETNAFGAFNVAIALIPLMKLHNYGRVVNVSSGMGQLTEMNGGYPGYRLSKSAINALTRILADELQNTNILVNSVCPGWVKTDMGGADAPRNITEGVDTIVWLATLPDGAATGYFWRDRRKIPW